MSGLSLLFIEDDDVDRMAFRFLVQEEYLDYDYRFADSVAETRILLEKRHFDIIISDYNLGDGTALDILTLERDIPIIIVTGAGSEMLAVTAMKAGAYDYLTKDSQHSYLKLLPIVIENTITRKRAEREALAALPERIRRETLQNFLRDASHDLRTAMSICNTSRYVAARHAEHLKAAISADPVDMLLVQETLLKIEERFHLLERHKQHFDEIVLGMLEMVRVDTLVALNMETVNFTPLIGQVVGSYLSAAASRNQSLTLMPSAQSLMIRCSPHELAGALQNLVKNALIYTPAEGCITLTTTTHGQEVMLAITDTGEGIPPEHLPHIFERFYRVDSARNITYARSGLGLSIVKRIIDLHHGRIEVESVPNEGTTFMVFLPLLPG
jgi:signal transduction histidine kinase